VVTAPPLIAAIAVTAACAALAADQGALAAAVTSADQVRRDGQHDFDFELGEWSTALKRLQQPLSGSTTWLEYSGISTVRGLLGNRANVVELSVSGPSGPLEGASLRLYDPKSHQWSLNFFNVANGHLGSPMTGEFIDGRGTFYGPDTWNDRAILVRFIITRVAAEVYRFEQAFSTDGGQSWEVNWIATDTRRAP
jgi:hypothetical protein